MHRRSFVRHSLGSLGAMAAGLDAVVPSTVAPEPAPTGAPAVHTTKRSSIVVVGGGAFGGWTALCLRERGHDVTLVDAYGPGNSRASSGDETRQARCGYGDRELYSRSAQRAIRAWRAREEEFGVSLVLPTGRLVLAPEWTPDLRATQAVLTRIGVPVEAMTQDDLRRRYPQMNPEGVGVGLLEPGAVVLRAKQAILTVARAFERKGGTIRIARVVPPEGRGATLDGVRTTDGDVIRADRYVFACGPWLPRVFPSLLGQRMEIPGREVFYFGLPAGDTSLAHPNFPNFSESGYYGFASIDGRGFKVCPSAGRPGFDPDNDERVVSPLEVGRARAFLAKRFPKLAGQPLTETRVCQLEMSEDEHFIIDRHPAFENVLITGAGSGHGFKHGPVIGDYIANRVLGEPTDPAFDTMVRLAR